MRSLIHAILMLCIATGLAAQLPHPDHVVVVLMENKGPQDVIGSASAPYLTALRGRGALLTASFGLHHPSQPNYIELFAGKELGVCTDTCPTPITAPNLAASLVAAHRTFVGYAEHFSPSCGPTAQQYVQRHCPWRDFAGIPSTASKDFSAFPAAAGFASLPTVAFVIPDLFGDMHSVNPTAPATLQAKHAAHGGKLSAQDEIRLEVAQGDTWLHDHLDAYAKWAVTHNSLLIITWDEDSSDHPHVSSCANGINTAPAQNPIPTLIIGAHVIPGSASGTPYTHYNVLRTIEDFFGLAPLGGSASVSPISGIWQ